MSKLWVGFNEKCKISSYFDKRQIYSNSILYNDIMEEIDPNKNGEKVKFTKTKS